MNPGSCRVVDTTLREGEQFATASFSGSAKVEIVRLLDELGVDGIELTTPVASPRSRADCELIAGLGTRARIIAHTRCAIEDVRAAAGCGVGGISMLMAGSPVLRRVSHGLEPDAIVGHAIEVAQAARREAPGVELRFSVEDAFRTSMAELLEIYLPLAASRLFDRFGIADTTGTATPGRVAEAVGVLTRALGHPLEFHGHNDLGCANANAIAAVEAGATHVSASVLGIGERNGIASLEGLIGLLYARDPEAARRRFRLDRLPVLARRVAAACGVEIPFNQPVVGAHAFTHKAGPHVKAVIADPRSYEVLDPSDFGLDRTVLVAHRLTGRNAIRHRATSIGVTLADHAVLDATRQVKEIADRRPIELPDVDAIIVALAGGRRPPPP